jgi:hypothetical protein
VEAALYVEINTDNQIKSDAEANARLEQRIRAKLRRFERRLTHVALHVSDTNGGRPATSRSPFMPTRSASRMR